MECEVQICKNQAKFVVEESRFGRFDVCPECCKRMKDSAKDYKQKFKIIGEIKGGN